nr:hypothetical protein [Tanacetum cinerariifolium]
MKARGILLMAHPNKDQLKFHSYKDAILLMEVIGKSTSNINEADNTAFGVSTAHSQALKNQENRGREYGRKTVLVENPTENALIAQDGIGGYDWSYQAEEEHPTNYALMALTSSGSSPCLDSEVKTGLGYKAASPVVESFVNSTKMLENQENVKSRSDKGYHAVPPPYTGNYIPPKPDLMFIDEQVKSEFVDVVSNFASSNVKTVELKHESVDVKNKGVYNTIETKHVRKNSFSPPIIEDYNSNDESKLNDFFCHLCTYEFCGNGAHVGYNCPAQVHSFQTLPIFPQQYPCCEDCGGLPEVENCQPPQYTVNHPIFIAHNDLLNSQNKLIEQVTSTCEMFGQFIQKKHEEEQVANSRYWKVPACCDDDNDYNFAITQNEPVESLIMGDEHLNTVLAMESDEFIKSSVENLVPNPRESKSLYDEDVPEKIFLNPLFEEEIIPIEIDRHHDNAESDLVESLHTHDSSLIISSKIDSLLDEFADELTLLKSIPPGIDETDCDPEEDIRLIERLLYDNSSPHPLKEFVFENSNADIDSFSPSPIPVEDSDSFMEEIDLSFTPDDPMPPGIEEDDYDSERDILILEELLDIYSLSLPKNESFHNDIPLFSRLPAKPPDDCDDSRALNFCPSFTRALHPQLHLGNP